MLRLAITTTRTIITTMRAGIVRLSFVRQTGHGTGFVERGNLCRLGRIVNVSDRSHPPATLLIRRRVVTWSNNSYSSPS